MPFEDASPVGVVVFAAAVATFPVVFLRLGSGICASDMVFSPTPSARPSWKPGIAGQAEEAQKRQAKEAEVVGFKLMLLASRRTCRNDSPSSPSGVAKRIVTRPWPAEPPILFSRPDPPLATNRLSSLSFACNCSSTGKETPRR